MTIMNTTISGGGTTPTGTKSITANGVYDVTDFASADVQVPTTAPAHYVETAFDANGAQIANPNVPNLNGVKIVGNTYLGGQYSSCCSSNAPGNYNVLNPSTIDMHTVEEINNGGFGGAFYLTSFSHADLSGLKRIYNSCSNMFYGARGLISGGVWGGFTVDISSLTTILSAPYMFYESYVEGDIDLSSLTSISGDCQYMFSHCSRITSVKLSSLTTISSNNCCQYMFSSCTGLTSIDFPSLSSVSGSTSCKYMFGWCTGITRLSFYALEPSGLTRNNVFNNMLSGVTDCTVHFPMRVQSTIGSWSDVTGGFGGTNTTVLFDIVCTLTGADTNTYTRSQKNSTSTATAWDNGGTLYYTSGTTEPTVGATIYSDAACTTAVTTISSIA